MSSSHREVMQPHGSGVLSPTPPSNHLHPIGAEGLKPQYASCGEHKHFNELSRFANQKGGLASQDGRMIHGMIMWGISICWNAGPGHWCYREVSHDVCGILLSKIDNSCSSLSLKYRKGSVVFECHFRSC